ncbi:MAG: hypothetical protein ABI305_06830 [Tepidiformaceae bacterium]
MQEPVPAVHPPVALGCTFAVLAVGIVVLIMVFGIVFLNSGAKGGTVELNAPAAYAAGSLEYESSENFYLVRLRSGTFLALSDLDAANRANAAKRCRVAPISTADPELPALLKQYAGGMSADAAGSSVLFRETCNGAIYDLTGARLDSAGPNLERLSIDTNRAGKLVVNVTKRTCTEHEGTNLFAPVKCG